MTSAAITPTTAPAADWTVLAGLLAARGAPLLGAALAGPAGGALGGLIGGALAEALGAPPTPGAVRAAIEADPEAPARLRAAEAARGGAVSDLAARVAEAERARAEAVAAAMRAEGEGRGPRAWWRPLFGLGFGLVYTAHGLVLAVAMARGDLTLLARVPDLTAYYAVAAAVVGVYVWRRSDEKIAGGG